MAGNAADVFKQLKKDHGDTVVTTADQITDFVRLPFGIFPLDLALGGGIPRGKCSMVYGPESSGKTTIALLLVKNYQKLYPDEVVVWIDAEWGFDAAWAQRLGVNVHKLFLCKPETGEQAAEMAEGLIYADDIGLIVIDSIAGMVPQAELEGDMARAQVGGNSVLIGKMFRKLVGGLIAQSKLNRFPTVFCINQLRKKIGVMFGDPETYCGGHAMRHYLNIVFRTYAKDIMVESVSKTNPSLKEVTLGMKKWKVPIVAKNSVYQFAVIPHSGLKVGESESWNTVLSYAKDFGYIAKDGAKWLYGGAEYKTQTEIVELLRSNPDMLYTLKSTLIEEAVNSENRIDPNE